MWLQLKLKIDEAWYFLGQLRAHTRYPRLFIFYLSAFVTSARSVTFLLQKQFAQADPGNVYETLRSELLSDAVCKYFVDLRNHMEKEGYPPLVVDLLVGHRNTETNELIWESSASAGILGEGDEGFDFLERLLRDEWDLVSMGGPSAVVEYVWQFKDFPGGEKQVTEACGAFANRLWYFTSSFRSEWERGNDPDAWSKKFDRVFLEN